MLIGNLMNRVELQRFNVTDKNEYGENDIEANPQADIYWTTFATRWAGVETTGSSESVGAVPQVTTIATHKFTLRYMSGVKASDRIKWDNRIFNIYSVVNVNEEKKVLELLTKEMQ